MEIIKRTDKKIVYKLPDFSIVDSAFVDSLVWPEGINVQMFLFEKPITGEHEIMPRIHSERLVGLGYSYTTVAAGAVVVPLPAGLAPINLEAGILRQFYYDTHLDFYKKWEIELGDEYMKEAAMVSEKLLSPARSVALSKGGRNAALLTIVNWKDCLDQPADWVTWVWIDPILPKDERNSIRSYFSQWLDVNSVNKVQCFVNSFNVRSQKFFRKIGFLPEWFHVVKRK